MILFHGITVHKIFSQQFKERKKLETEKLSRYQEDKNN